MASIANTLSTVDGNLKRNYAPKIVKLVPMLCLLQQYNPDETDQAKLPPIKVRWSEVAFNGQSFQYPTKVQSGQGVSYNGSGGASRTLEDALNLQVVQASIIGFEMVNRQQMTYSAAFAGDAAGTKAIETNAKLMLEDLKDVLYSRNEMSALWGQNGDTGYGKIESQTLSSTTLTVVFTAASFAPGWWPGQIGARVEFFNGTTFVPSGQQGSSYGTVSSVDVANRTVVFTTTGSGFSNGTVPAANNICFMKGALTTGGTYNEMIGLYKQLTATSGTLFGLDRATYALLQGNTYAVGNKRLTKAIVTQASMVPLNKGNLLDLVLVVSTNTWADLANEDLAQRIFDSSYSGQVSKSGSRQLSYEVLNRSIRVVCHPYMQAGVAFLTSEEHLSWVGSTDVTFRLPTGENLFRLVDNTNAYESQAVSIKQLYHEAPGKGCVLTGIVNTA
jgi:hypothetical protein